MYAMTERELDFSYVFNAKHLHVSSYYLQKGIRPQLVEIFRKAKEAHLTVSLDTNDDPEDRWSGDIQLLLRYLNILFLNEREACKLGQTEDIEKAVETLSQKVSLLVVKRGSRGATARAGKEKLSAFPPVVDMVDPIGAGDTFDAGFVHKFIRGAKTEECLKFANVTGALSVTRPGGTEAFRDAAVREAFLRKNAGALESPRATLQRPKL
jgi:sugar/nucleoside kinase (ribokinase family)